MNSKPIWWTLLGLTCFVVTAGFLKEHIQKSETAGAFVGSLPVLGRVQSFALTDEQGRPFTLDRLRGKIWIANFIFTRCGGQCPLMSRHVEKIQKLLPKEAPVQLISITVDPDYDKPAILKEYAKEYVAQQERWHFLTGSHKAIATLMRDSFHLPGAAASNDPKEPLYHSDRFVLVDQAFQIRGYYTGTDEASVDKLVNDMGRL